MLYFGAITFFTLPTIPSGMKMMTGMRILPKTMAQYSVWDEIMSSSTFIMAAPTSGPINVYTPPKTETITISADFAQCDNSGETKFSNGARSAPARPLTNSNDRGCIDVALFSLFFYNRDGIFASQEHTPHIN